jgi:hypothetical protein
MAFLTLVAADESVDRCRLFHGPVLFSLLEVGEVQLNGFMAPQAAS